MAIIFSGKNVGEIDDPFTANRTFGRGDAGDEPQNAVMSDKPALPYRFLFCGLPHTLLVEFLADRLQMGLDLPLLMLVAKGQ